MFTSEFSFGYSVAVFSKYFMVEQKCGKARNKYILNIYKQGLVLSTTASTRTVLKLVIIFI